MSIYNLRPYIGDLPLVGGYIMPPYVNTDGEGTFDHFVANFDTSITGGTGSPADQLILPFPASYEVHWGDGTINNLNSHTYAGGAGVYTVEIFEPVTDLRFNNGGDCRKLVDMISLGDGFEINNTATWYGCVNMAYSTTDTPIINTTNLSNTFSGCGSINGGDLSNWDMSSVLNMTNMFFQADSFTGSGIEDWNVGNCTTFTQCFFGADSLAAPIGVWDMSSATNIGGIFRSNTGFNQPLNNWNVSNVQQMNHAFAGATSFAQDLDQWDVGSATTCHAMFSSNFNGNISTWVFSSAIKDLSWMFTGNNTFNQDISGWNVASVTNFSNMFSSCDDFDQDLTGWDFSSATNITTMLAFLINLDGQSASLTVGLTLGALNLTYTGFGPAKDARDSLIAAPALMTIAGDIASSVPNSGYDFSIASDLIQGAGPTDVAGWQDAFGANDLAQAIAANQPVFDTDHIVFDGNDYLDVNPALVIGDSSTVIFKMKSIASPATYARIISSKLVYNDPTGFEITIDNVTSDSITVIGSSGTFNSVAVDNFVTGEPVIAVVFSGTAASVYSNGIFKGTATIATVVDNINPLVLGSRGGGADPFEGNMYNVLIYQSALTAEEIETISASLA